MSSQIEQSKAPVEKPDELTQKPNERGDLAGIRSQLEQLVGNPEWRKFASEKIACEYEFFLSQQGSNISVSSGSGGSARMHEAKPVSNANELKSVYDYMKNEWEKVTGIKRQIDDSIKKAVDDKILSEKDKDFYREKMEENVLNGKQIVTPEVMERAKKDVEKSLENRKKEKEKFDSFRKDTVIKDGFLVVDEKTKIPLPDEKGYLELSVPQRRELLKNIEKVLPKAKEYAKKNKENQEKIMTREYEGFLNKARAEGWIGSLTIKKYMEGFRSVNFQRKQEWMEEMKNGNQLKRYKDLWTNIRSALKGQTLAQTEALRDKMGYTELFEHFGKLKISEGQRLDRDYEARLNKAFQEKIISRHTLRSFLDNADGIRNQDIKGKYHYIEEFEHEMSHYHDLRKKIDQLPKAPQARLNKMYKSEAYGYTEIEDAYKKEAGLKENKKADFRPGEINEKEDDSVHLLNDIREPELREGIRDTFRILDLGSPEKKQAFLVTLQQMLIGQEESMFNQENFQTSMAESEMKEEKNAPKESLSAGSGKPKDSEDIFALQSDFQRQRQQKLEAPAAKEKATEPGAEVIDFQKNFRRKRNEQQGVRGKESIDQENIQKQMKQAEMREQGTVFQTEGFKEKQGRQGRVALVEINREKGLRSWQIRNQNQKYRNALQGGHDKVSFAVRTKNGQTVELNFRQLKIMERSLRAKIGAQQQLKKAA